MCGGGSFKKVLNTVTLGIPAALEKVVTPELPSMPTIEEQKGIGEEEVAKVKEEAAAAAKEKDLARKRAIAKGGRKSTILAGAPTRETKKNLLGS